MWNKWIAKHSGIPPEFAIGHSLESLFPDGLSAAFKTALKNALSHKLPIVLSNALHRSPLPLFSVPVTKGDQPRLQQSTALTPIIDETGKHFCLIQITDATTSVKRERVLRSHSEQLSIEATTDGLTSCFNRRFFDDRFKAEFARAQRQSTPLSLIMLDIDFFKDYNDNYGHPAGDKALISVVNALKTQLNRATDVVTRYGGEEFAIILPGCAAEGSLSVAEKLRMAVIDLNIPHLFSKANKVLTISIGITTYMADTPCSASCLLDTADIALYRAKKDGRNCVRQLITPHCRKTGPNDSQQPRLTVCMT